MNHVLCQFSHSTVPMNHIFGQVSHPSFHFSSLKLIFIPSSFYFQLTNVVPTTRKFCTYFLFPTSMLYNSQTSLVLIQSPKSNKHRRRNYADTHYAPSRLGSYTLFTTILPDTLNLLFSLSMGKHASRQCNFQLEHNAPTLQFRIST